MLSKLYIENYALIDRLEISFEKGFSVITGETGAGKSILLGALSLILGLRADSSVLLDNSRKCIVEGIFQVGNYNLEEFFRSNDLDFEDDLILRREIHQNGKSRAFINDSPVTLNLMKELGDRLLNIHSQHSIITLNDADFQLAVIDDFAGIHRKVSLFRQQYKEYRKMTQLLEEFKELEAKAGSEKDYNQFLFEELDAACLKEGELEEAEQRLEFVSHAEEIKNKLAESSGILSENEDNVLSRLAGIHHILNDITAYHPDLKEIAERIQSNLIDLKDIASVISRVEQGIEIFPDEQEKLSQRLDLIYRLLKKHNAGSVGELLEIREEIGKKLTEAGSLEGKILELEKEIGEAFLRLEKEASEISSKRKAVCSGFEKKITGILLKLGMPDAKFVVEMSRVDLAKDGQDRVRFLFSANKGFEPSDVAKIASGGELSRLMLSIKSIISEKNLLPTIIFDEIDSGVSGEIAARVGAILKAMAGTMQVIAITHLPQIAGKGENHYRVYKISDPDVSRTNIRLLELEERIVEIAKMLSSEKVTESALGAARELINI